MPEIQIPNVVIVILQIFLAFAAAFLIALWVSMIIWTFRDVRSRSRDVFAIALATLMTVVFGPLGLLLYLLLRPKETLAEVYERSLEEEALLQDLEQRAVCPGCRRRIEEAWQVCPDCHTILKKTCLNCGQLLHLRWSICPYCASPAVDTTAHDDYREESTEAETSGYDDFYQPVAEVDAAARGHYYEAAEDEVAGTEAPPSNPETL